MDTQLTALPTLPVLGRWSPDPVLCDRRYPCARPTARDLETCPSVGRTAGSGDPRRTRADHRRGVDGL